MGFNRRKLEAEQKAKADAAAALRRATDAQVLEDAERLIAVWNERQAKRMPMLFSPTIGAAVTAGYWFLWVRCPACRTINAIDLRTLDRHRDAAVTSLIPHRRNARGAQAPDSRRLGLRSKKCFNFPNLCPHVSAHWRIQRPLRATRRQRAGMESWHR
jgi:hypothetical protein